MTQYGILKLKVPEGTTLAELKTRLISEGYEVEISGVFIQMFQDMEIPEQFVPKK